MIARELFPEGVESVDQDVPAEDFWYVSYTN